jgi:hypothetical protein
MVLRQAGFVGVSPAQADHRKWPHRELEMLFNSVDGFKDKFCCSMGIEAARKVTWVKYV